MRWAQSWARSWAWTRGRARRWARARARVKLTLTFPTVQTIHRYNFLMKHSCMQWVAKELAVVLPYLFDSDLQRNLRQGWKHAFNGNCYHCSWKKPNNWLQCQSSLRCCNQSIHVFQNCFEQSQKHVCNSAYNHYNNMETRLSTLSVTVSACVEQNFGLFCEAHSIKPHFS